MKKILSLTTLAFLLMTTVALAGGTYLGADTGVGVLVSEHNVVTLKGDQADGFAFGLFAAGLDKSVMWDFRGKEDQMLGVDFGYTKPVAKYLRLGLEGSMAYHNDKRTDTVTTEVMELQCHEHYTTQTTRTTYRDEYLLGAGVVVGVPVTEKFELMGTYNTLKGISAGFMFRF
jgi:opacity protein-like surface antigen